MNNDKREQARKYELYAAILERDANPLTPHGIANGLGAQLIRQRAAALLREAEAATAPDVSEAELAEWEALCEKATPGPWDYEHDSRRLYYGLDFLTLSSNAAAWMESV